MKPGHFGGKIVEILEYEKPKLNIFEEYKRVLEGIPMNEEALVPLLFWYSNHKRNIEEMQKINKSFFYSNKSILAHGVFLNINRNVRFIKYPKKIKEENELDFLIPYIKKLYSWSDKEYDFYKKFINLEDNELHELLHKKFGLEKSELRKLGIKIETPKIKYEAAPKIKGFF